MITSVEISGFRGVREGGVDGLSPLSILVGPNNSGKSTCLEAVAVVGLGNEAQTVAGLLLRRGGPPHNALEHIVTSGALSSSISLQGSVKEQDVRWSTEISMEGLRRVEQVARARDEGLEEPLRRLAVKWKSEPGANGEGATYVDPKGRCSDSWVDSASLLPFQTKLIDTNTVRAPQAMEDAYSLLDWNKKVSVVVRALQRSMPGLTDLRILKAGPDFILHTFRDDEAPVPAYLAGDGFKRFLELASVAVGMNDGVVLLEEPESFQHPRYLEELATLLLLEAKKGTQIILSTHSLELIDLLLHSPEALGLPYPTVHRLRLTRGKLQSVAVSREDALIGRDELLQDLRA